MSNSNYIRLSDIAVSNRAIRRIRAEFPGVSRLEATRYIRQLVSEGTSRPTPRHWMRPGAYDPGTRFVYSQFEPDFCVLVSGDLVRDIVVRGDAVAPPAQRGPLTEAAASFDWRTALVEEAA